MTPETGLAPVMPRWMGTLWVWLPVLAALLLFGGAAALQGSSGPRATWWIAAAVATACAYAGRERWPAAALGATLAVLASARLPRLYLLTSGFDVIYLLLLFVPVLPLVVIASRASPRLSWLAPAVMIAVSVAVSPDPPWSIGTATTSTTLAEWVLSLGVPTMIAVAGWLAGYALLARQRYADALLQRAISLERTREAEMTRAVAEERTRIARELHDVITHSVAVMVVQASAADAVWDSDPVQARASLAAVEESGRTVMADLRGVLRAMRGQDAESVVLRAQPGLAELPALVEQIRTTGLTAELTSTGQIGRVTPLSALSLLRIAQESVTNALRHARARSITIDLAVEADTVRLTVTDDGVGLLATHPGGDLLDPHRHGGHGVLGMRERAQAIGGTLALRDGADGGTVVTVSAPLREDARG